MQIKAQNIDDWIDDYLLGKLRDEDEQLAEEVLFAHPELGSTLAFRQKVIEQSKRDGETLFAREISRATKQAKRAEVLASRQTWWQQTLELWRHPGLIGGLATAALLLIVVTQLFDNPLGVSPEKAQIADDTFKQPAFGLESEQAGRRDLSSLESIPRQEAIAGDSNAENSTQSAPDSEQSGNLAWAPRGNRPQSSQASDGSNIAGNPSVSSGGSGSPGTEAVAEEFLEDSVEYEVIETFAMADGDSDVPIDASYGAASQSDFTFVSEDSNNTVFDSAAPRQSLELQAFDSQQVTSDSMSDTVQVVTNRGLVSERPAPIRMKETNSKPENRESFAVEQPRSDTISAAQTDKLILPEIDQSLARSRSMSNAIGRLSNPANGAIIPQDNSLTFEWTERQPDNCFLVIVDSTRQEFARYKLPDKARTFTPDEFNLPPGRYEWFLAGKDYLSLRAGFQVVAQNESDKD